ncbi:hypothetical protein GQ44DRAFT_758036 [Phaeosphaeriaceae sp. PMI808]|nr:hypothetical protein GQ44DRAFT_758036 [Phaeosphaeriaceae sp. PMI808]
MYVRWNKILLLVATSSLSLGLSAASCIECSEQNAGVRKVEHALLPILPRGAPSIPNPPSPPRPVTPNPPSLPKPVTPGSPSLPKPAIPGTTPVKPPGLPDVPVDDSPDDGESPPTSAMNRNQSISSIRASLTTLRPTSFPTPTSWTNPVSGGSAVDVQPRLWFLFPCLIFGYIIVTL